MSPSISDTHQNLDTLFRAHPEEDTGDENTSASQGGNGG